MSVLQSVLARAARQYTCLVVPRLHVLSQFAGLRTSQCFRDKATVEPADSCDGSSPVSPEHQSAGTGTARSGPAPRRDIMYNQDMVPGKYFPTQAVYEMQVDGVRYDEVPFLHLICTKNNTKAGAYSFDGAKTFDVQSGGTVGFKHTRKSTNVAAQAVGMTIGQNLLRKGVKNIRVIVRGTGSGRLPSIKGVQLSGVNIVSISDKTHPSFSTRPRKRPRK